MLKGYQLYAQSLKAAIKTYWQLRGYSPTIREVQALTGLKSPSTTYQYLEQMKLDGIILFEKGKERTLRITGQQVIFAPECAHNLTRGCSPLTPCNLCHEK